MNHANTSDSTEEIVVWLPDKTGIVSYEPEHCITVKVHLNASLGSDFGFFRVGFDYSLSTMQDVVEWLYVSCRDEKRTLETANFGRRGRSKITDHILWAK